MAEYVKDITPFAKEDMQNILHDENLLKKAMADFDRLYNIQIDGTKHGDFLRAHRMYKNGYDQRQKEYDHYVRLRNLQNCFYRGQFAGEIPRWMDISGLDVDSKILFLEDVTRNYRAKYTESDEQQEKKAEAQYIIEQDHLCKLNKIGFIVFVYFAAKPDS